MEPQGTINAEELLRHSEWMRSLARSLMLDPSAADDVVQDAWMAALRKPPSTAQPLGPWLASVVRHLASKRKRADGRRTAREEQAQTPLGGVAPGETLARLEIARTLVEAVAALEEPLRTTIVLRFFEERSSAEIARLQVVPAATVRWRVQRGLLELRARLDARHGERAHWLSALAPLVGNLGAPATPWTATPHPWFAAEGILLMSTLKIAGAVGIVLIAAAAWWWNRPVERPAIANEVLETRTNALEVALQPELASERGNRDEAARFAVGPVVPQVATTLPNRPAESTKLATVDARFVDALGVPWIDIELAPTEARWGAPARSGPDGRVRLDVTIAERSVPGRGVDDLQRVFEDQVEWTATGRGCTTVGLNATVRAGEIVHLGDVVLAPSIRLQGKVRLASGGPAAGATVGLSAAVFPDDDEGRMHRFGSQAFDEAVTTKSASDGSFVLEGVGAGSWRLWGKAEGTRYTWSEPFVAEPRHDVLGLELVITPIQATDRIAGRVIDPDGKPVPNGGLMWQGRWGLYGVGRQASTDSEGRFDFLIERDGIYELNAGRPGFADAIATGVVPGTLDVVLQLGVLRAVEIVLVDPSGQPIEDGQFTQWTPGLGQLTRTQKVTAGRYRVSMADIRCKIEASAPRFRKQRTQWIEAGALPASLEIVLQPAPIVRGRVQAEGHAVAGARVTLHADVPSATTTVNGYRCLYSPKPSAKAMTDADGGFALDCDVDAGFWIRAEAEGFADTQLGPLQPAQGTGFDLTLTHGGTIEGRVLLRDGKDGAGTIVALNHGDGRAFTLRAGPGGTYRIEGLSAGQWQVSESEVEIDRSRTNYSSFGNSSPMPWSCEVVAGTTTRFDLDLTKP